MTDLEQALRDELSEQARGVRVDVDLLGPVAARRRDRRRTRVGLAVPLAVVVALVAGGVATGLPGHRSEVRNTPAAVDSGASAYPAGTRPVTWDGIQLDVPAAWTSRSSDSHRCAAAESTPGGEVDYRGTLLTALFACSAADRPVRQHLELGTAYSYEAFAAAQAGPPGTTASRPTTFAGYAAEGRTAMVARQVVTEITVPSLPHGVFTLTTDSAATAETILSTAHRVTTDEHGCPVSDPRTPAGGDAGTPVGGVVCAYASGRLTSSVALDATATAALAGALSRAPATGAAVDLQDVPPPTAYLALRDAAGSERAVVIAPAQARPVLGAAGTGYTGELDFDLVEALPAGFVGSSSGDLPGGCQSCALGAAPPPTRPVGWRGVTLDVPATWSDEDGSFFGCQGPGSYVDRQTSASPTGPVNCPSIPVGTIQRLVLSDDTYGQTPSGVAIPVTFAGVSATERVQAPSGSGTEGATVAVDVPGSHATYTVQAPTVAEAEAILATARPGGDSTTPAPSTTPTPSTPPTQVAPTGTRPVTWDGIQLDVPADWTDGGPPDRCTGDEPGGDVAYPSVNVDGGVLCHGGRAIRQYLELGTDLGFGAGVHGGGTPTTFAGLPALQVRIAAGDQVATRITVPSLPQGVFTLTTDTAQEADAILATAREVDADENGCAVQQPDPQVGGTVVNAVGGSVCGYARGRLTSGATLDARSATALAGAIGRLPVEDTPADTVADEQHDGTDPVAVIRLVGSDGATRVVVARFGVTPAVQGAGPGLTGELIDAIDGVLPASWVGGWPGALAPGCSSCVASTPPPRVRAAS